MAKEYTTINQQISNNERTCDGKRLDKKRQNHSTFNYHKLV